MTPLTVLILPSHLIPVTEVSFVLTDINNLVKLADIIIIPVTNSLPSTRSYSTGFLSLNNTDTEVSCPLEQVIFLCVDMGIYNGPGGCIVTIEQPNVLYIINSTVHIKEHEVLTLLTITQIKYENEESPKH